jgi:putative addiction module component (TIGR02574 family)
MPPSSPSPAASQVLAAAMALPEAERAVVVAEIAASLPNDDSDDPELLAEVDRRLERHRQGLSVGRPWPEVRAEIEARLAAARPTSTGR